MKTQTEHDKLNWTRSDFEQKFGFKGAKYTDTNTFLTFSLGLVFWLVLYGPLFFIPERTTQFPWEAMFLERGPTPYVTVFFFCWSLAILFVKWRKLVFQRKTLDTRIVDVSSDFTIAPGSAQDLLIMIRKKVDDTRHFLLLNRIALVLANLKNTGARSDVSEMLRSQGEIDEAQMESSYGLIKGFVWSIPILGFIGTVLGLSKAIGSFGNMLADESSLDQVKSGLQTVTGGLSTAFDTTLLALVSALIIQLLMTMLKKKEEMFLDECNEFCQEQIVSRVRITHLSPQVATV